MTRVWRGAIALALVAAATGADGASAQEYLPFEALTDELESLAGSSDKASLRSLGESHEGRDVWLMTLGSPDGPPLETRPGLLVVGNLQGDHVVGSTLAVEAIRYLLAADGTDDDVTRLLAENVVYVVPRLNPDGAEAMFGDVTRDRRGNVFPWDDDNDGRIDEDGPDDLNGDGLVTLMRVPDPAGAFLLDPDEPRLLKRADPAAGEDGTFTLYLEGRDDDGDGFYNEDAADGVDLDRNFQHAYPYWAADAGRYMVSEPESRALMDFVVANRNIAAVLTFGLTDNLVTPPDARGALAGARMPDLAAFAAESNDGIDDVGVFRTGGGGFGFGFGGGPQLRGAQPGRDNDPNAGRRPSTTVHQADQDYYATVSRAYRELTGIEEVGLHREPAGAFFEFGYFHYGVPSFSTPGWGLPEAGGDEGEGEGGGARARSEGGLDAQLLARLEGAGIDAFVPWESVQHPTLGAVEVGGFRPYVLTNPPEAELAALGEAHGAFVARLGGMLPRVRIVDTSVTAHGGGVFTVEATIENSGYLPTSLRHGVVAGAVDATLVQIQVEPDAIVTGDDKSATVERLEGSGSRQTFSWLIRGDSGDRVEIRLRAQKGGSDTATVTLG
ncbi:MAG TPA: M14 family metallopeptidase [Longimicrobiales bacterium]|nr:M14 family metallopeptidase [Longimicrobiales bacterium]